VTNAHRNSSICRSSLKTIVFEIYYYNLFNISYTIEKFIYILYTTIMVYEKEAKKGVVYEKYGHFFMVYEIFSVKIIIWTRNVKTLL
jgi:hypothetical protein